MADETLGKLLVEIGIEATGFQGQMQEISRRMGLAKAEFMAAGGSVKGFQDTTEGASAKAKMLTEQIELQRAKTAALESEYQQAASGLGENSKQAQDLKMKLDGTRGEMARMEAELSGLSSHSDDSAKHTNNLKEHLKLLGEKAGEVGKELAKMAAEGMAEIGAMAGEAAHVFAEFGGEAVNSAKELTRMADVTGMSTERLQELKYAGNELGVDLDTLSGAQAKLTKAMSSASDSVTKNKDTLVTIRPTVKGVADANEKLSTTQVRVSAAMKDAAKHPEKLAKAQDALAKASKGAADAQQTHTYVKHGQALNDVALAFKKLGVSVQDGTGHLRDSKDVMAEAMDKLGGMKNETERDALAMKIFGKSAMELNPIIKAGGDKLKEMADQAHKTGAVMSGDTVGQLNEFGHAVDSLKESATGLAGTALTGLMPALNGLIDVGKDLATSFATATKSGDWSAFAAKVGESLQKVAAQAVEMLPTFIKIGTQMLTGLVNALVTAVPVVLPELVNGVVALLDAITTIVTENGPMLITTAINAVGTLIQGLLQALPQLAQAAIQMLLALVNGISAQLPTLIPAAVKAVLTIVQTLVNNLPQLIDAAIKLILALVDGLIKALPEIIKAAPEIITSLVNGIVGALPKLMDAALQIITALVKAFPDYFPKIITATAEILSAIVGGLIDAVGKVWEFIPKFWSEIKDAFASKDWGQMGKDIIDGLVGGIKSVGGRIWDALKGIVSSAIDSFKSFFGIHSPSTYMRDQLGIHLGGGIAEGIAGSAGMVGSAMMSLRSQLNLDGAFGGGTTRMGVAGGASSTTTVDNSRAPQIHIHGNVNLADKGSQNATLQQLQFLAAL